MRVSSEEKRVRAVVSRGAHDPFDDNLDGRDVLVWHQLEARWQFQA